jgi:hypothetical protein
MNCCAADFYIWSRELVRCRPYRARLGRDHSNGSQSDGK